MITLSIILNLLIMLMCFGGSIWSEYKDNFGERMGMVAIGMTCLIMAIMAQEFQIGERTDVMLEFGILLYGWGQFCAKLSNRRRRPDSTLSAQR